MAKTQKYEPPKPEQLLGMVTDDYLKAIGLVISQWSTMEVILEQAIWQSARLRNDLGRIMTTQLQAQGKMDLLQTILSHTKPPLGERFKKVAEYIRDCLLGKRNIVAHGHWSQFTPMEQHAHVSKFSARGKFVSLGGPITLDELRSLARDIADVSCWLMELVSKLPALKRKRDGLGYKTPDAQNRRDCATLKSHALRPLASLALPQPRGRATKQVAP